MTVSEEEVLYRLWSADEEVKDPVAQRGTETHFPEFDEGMMVLNGKLESINNSLTCVFLLSKWP